MTGDQGEERHSLPNIQPGYPAPTKRCGKTARFFGNSGVAKMSEHCADEARRKNYFFPEKAGKSQLCFVFSSFSGA
jgi:hypothetical protein